MLPWQHHPPVAIRKLWLTGTLTNGSVCYCSGVGATPQGLAVSAEVINGAIQAFDRPPDLILLMSRQTFSDTPCFSFSWWNKSVVMPHCYFTARWTSLHLKSLKHSWNICLQAWADFHFPQRVFIFSGSTSSLLLSQKLYMLFYHGRSDWILWDDQDPLKQRSADFLFVLACHHFTEAEMFSSWVKPSTDVFSLRVCFAWISRQGEMCLLLNSSLWWTGFKNSSVDGDLHAYSSSRAYLLSAGAPGSSVHFWRLKFQWTCALIRESEIMSVGHLAWGKVWNWRTYAEMLMASSVLHIVCASFAVSSSSCVEILHMRASGVNVCCSALMTHTPRGLSFYGIFCLLWVFGVRVSVSLLENINISLLYVLCYTCCVMSDGDAEDASRTRRVISSKLKRLNRGSVISWNLMRGFKYNQHEMIYTRY